MDTVVILIASAASTPAENMARSGGSYQTSSVAPILGEPVLSAVAGALQLTSPPRWLASGEACEWQIAASPEDFRQIEDHIRQIVHPAPIDVAVIPADNRRKALLIADMDSTIIGQECIDELAILAGAGSEISAITERAMRGELEFEEALQARVARLKSLPHSAIARVISERLTFTGGGRQLVQTMRAHGARTALVSGGFTAFTAHVAEVVGFDHHRGNTLLVENDILTGEVAMPILGKDAKVAALNELCEANGITLENTLAVGDGANDIPMLELAGLGVAFHAKPKTRDAASVRIDHCDLSALLYLQGYTSDEFKG